MARGKVTKWNGQTGFIKDDTDGQSVFFGDRSLRGLIPEQVVAGLPVEFDRVQGPKGPNARNVRTLGAVTQSPGVTLNQSQPIQGWALPLSTQDVIKQVLVRDRHPVIQLDRLSIPGDQKVQRNSLHDAIQATGDRQWLASVLARRRATLNQLDKVRQWNQSTLMPMTLHLSRANTLENAGICLHPVYGFAYLPGSGLKGMARALATNEGYDLSLLTKLFGNEPGAGKDQGQLAGAIVFHDAWPTRWPKLIIDIVNNHHPDYYKGIEAAGDWEAPNPVYFLAIAEKTEFTFAISPRRFDCDSQLLEDAYYWLGRALTDEGAGSKTAAGYGGFTPPEAASIAGLDTTKESRSIRRQWALSLDTPAFLAGASQADQADCNLRSATLRGQLRSWWRKMHSGFVTTDELRRMEAALWGDTNQGGAIRFKLVTTKKPTVSAHRHPPERDSGLKYLAYGMDDGDKHRHRAGTDGQWQLNVAFRQSKFALDAKKLKSGMTIPADVVQKQFGAALWLLSNFGGVGAKARKGFGSLRMDEASAQTEMPHELAQVREAAASFREFLQIDRVFDESLAESPALFHAGTIIQSFEISAADPLSAIERVGQCYRQIASSQKHLSAKVTLGLPRKIHGPRKEPLRHQKPESHQPPLQLKLSKPKDKPGEQRHSAPVHLHIKRLANDKWRVTMVATPVKYLPSFKESSLYLQDFANQFAVNLSQPTKRTNSPIAATTGPGLVEVEVTVLERRGEGKPQFRVQETGLPRPGMLIDGIPPNPLPEIGAVIRVYRSDKYDHNSPRYRWNPPPQSDRPRKK